VGEIHSLALEAIGRAQDDAVVVLEDGEVLKAIVGNSDRLTGWLEVCSDRDIEFELRSATECGRCRL
jgi:16S rRNA G966 N2-methylase RsmD